MQNSSACAYSGSHNLSRKCKFHVVFSYLLPRCSQRSPQTRRVCIVFMDTHCHRRLHSWHLKSHPLLGVQTSVHTFSLVGLKTLDSRIPMYTDSRVMSRVPRSWKRLHCHWFPLPSLSIRSQHICDVSTAHHTLQPYFSDHCGPWLHRVGDQAVPRY